jgi:TetR/AcrR family transcriptional repressor of nem operon
MRKSRQEAAQTRRHIVETAAAEFRRKGTAGAGLSDLMAAAGLTHGGFYRHFESKDQLLAEASAAAIGSLDVKLAETIGKKKGARARKAIVDLYLSADHRDDPATGCLFGALGSELARADDATRAAATAGLKNFVSLLAGTFDGDRAQAERRAMVMVSTLVGALTLARIVDADKLSAAILKDAEEALAAG